MSNLDKLNDLVKAFSDGLDDPAAFIKATQAVNNAILKMDMNETDKKTLARVCIDAASLIDVEVSLTTLAVIDSFRDYLKDELEHLDSSAKSTFSP